MIKPVCMILLIWMPCLAWTAEQLPDPTKPFGFDIEPELIIQERDTVQDHITWNLSGIRIAENRRSAILNGHIVNIGDVVNGAQILEIEPAWIIIDYQKQRIRLELLDVDIKQQMQSMAKNNDAESK